MLCYGPSKAPQNKTALKLQEQGIKLVCNLMTQVSFACEIINEVNYLFAIYFCVQANNLSTVKFALGSILNYTNLRG